jgi:hypothetical protein
MSSTSCDCVAEKALENALELLPYVVGANLSSNLGSNFMLKMLVSDTERRAVGTPDVMMMMMITVWIVMIE